jgi:hypothetical protein
MMVRSALRTGCWTTLFKHKARNTPQPFNTNLDSQLCCNELEAHLLHTFLNAHLNSHFFPFWAIKSSQAFVCCTAHFSPLNPFCSARLSHIQTACLSFQRHVPCHWLKYRVIRIRRQKISARSMQIFTFLFQAFFRLMLARHVVNHRAWKCQV